MTLAPSANGRVLLCNNHAEIIGVAVSFIILSKSFIRKPFLFKHHIQKGQICSLSHLSVSFCFISFCFLIMTSVEWTQLKEKWAFKIKLTKSPQCLYYISKTKIIVSMKQLIIDVHFNCNCINQLKCWNYMFYECWARGIRWVTWLNLASHYSTNYLQCLRVIS